MTIMVVGPREIRSLPKGSLIVNTTSSSKDFKGLSPFHLGPCKLYDDYVAQTMENGYQMAKVYASFVASDGSIKDAYWNWAQKGWDNPRAVRYPMGKGAKPLYSLWKGCKLTYLQARIQIYFPLYKRAVRETKAFARLQKLCEREPLVYLFDYDGTLDKDKTFMDVLLDSSRPMGHSHVLKAMLMYGECCTIRGIATQLERKADLENVWKTDLGTI